MQINVILGLVDYQLSVLNNVFVLRWKFWDFEFEMNFASSFVL